MNIDNMELVTEQLDQYTNEMKIALKDKDMQRYYSLLKIVNELSAHTLEEINNTF